MSKRPRFIVAGYLAADCMVCGKKSQPCEHWDHDLRGRICRECAPAMTHADDALAETGGLCPPPDDTPEIRPSTSLT